MSDDQEQPEPASVAKDLTAAHLEVLEFARARWRFPGRREAVILERFGHTQTRYFQRLHHLLELPAALAYDPLLVNRLRDRRDRLRNRRNGRTTP